VTIAAVTLDAKTFLPTRVDSDVALAAAGDTPAFERLYRLHLPRMHSLVRRMIGPQEADEVTQDIFVRAWQKLGTFRGDAAFGTWLHRLGVNVVIERRRSWAILRTRLNDDPDVIELMSAPPVRVDATLDLEQALDTLPAGAREIFVLHDVEGYKHREIADLLDITTGTSKRQLHRARLLMRRYLTA
jgi:RNA polymerase sigma-70 factor (ECF subfamily)